MKPTHNFTKGYDSETEEVLWGERYRKFHLDPNGYFLIRLNRDAGQIEVGLVQDRCVTKKIYGKSAGEIRDCIDREQIFDRGFPHLVQHAMYLGMELGKAEVALRHNLVYVQDDLLDVTKRWVPTK